MLAIPSKRYQRSPIAYLIQPEIEALLAAPDLSIGLGRRDRTLLLVALQTGLRVSELIGLRWQDVSLGTGAHVLAPVFPTARATSLSRDGVAYILTKPLARARQPCPSLEGKRVSLHVLRHSAAMALLHSGVDCAVIALWLGHESMETTQI
jgi:integrase/recombinase XerD